MVSAIYYLIPTTYYLLPTVVPAAARPAAVATRHRRSTGIVLRGDVWDMHDKPEVLPDPARLLFFRQCPDVSFTFVSPLFSLPGFVYEMLMLDVLHFLDLGVCARLIGCSVQRLLECGAVYGNPRTHLGGYSESLLRSRVAGKGCGAGAFLGNFQLLCFVYEEWRASAAARGLRRWR